MKSVIITTMVLGSIVGGYLPALWDGSVFSMSSIFLSGAGGLVGIWLGYKMAVRMGL